MVQERTNLVISEISKEFMYYYHFYLFKSKGDYGLYLHLA